MKSQVSLSQTMMLEIINRKQLEEEVRKIIQEALIDEIYTTPKPGLVDSFDNGGHGDTDCILLEKSAGAITPYLAEIFREGLEWRGRPKELFYEIQKTMIYAKYEMTRVSGEADIFKDIIVAFGILCAAAGLSYRKERIFVSESICRMVVKMIGSTLEEKFQNDYEVLSRTALPFMRIYHKEKINKNDANVQVLLKIISELPDASAMNDSSKEDTIWLQNQAKEILKYGGVFGQKGKKKLRKLNRDCIERGISPEKAEDLLAVTILLHKLEQL